MSLEEYTPDIESSEWWWQSSEATREVSEKFKEGVKKAWIKRKKAQKDEKKAKKYDFLLAKFLVELIIKKKYDNLLGYLFICLDKWYWTNFLLWILSLIYMPISDKIREFQWTQSITFNYEISEHIIEFNDNIINKELKNRINNWVEDIETTLFIESSEIIEAKIISIIDDDESIIEFTWQVFAFFFKELNIHIKEEKSNSYWEFIIWELKKSLKKKKEEN